MGGVLRSSNYQDVWPAAVFGLCLDHWSLATNDTIRCQLFSSSTPARLRPDDRGPSTLGSIQSTRLSHASSSVSRASAIGFGRIAASRRLVETRSVAPDFGDDQSVPE